MVYRWLRSSDGVRKNGSNKSSVLPSDDPPHFRLTPVSRSHGERQSELLTKYYHAIYSVLLSIKLDSSKCMYLKYNLSKYNFFEIGCNFLYKMTLRS